MALDAIRQAPRPASGPTSGEHEPGLEHVPLELKLLAQWVLWRCENRTNGGDARRTKVPCQTDGRRASSTDPRTWCSYQRAHDVITANPERFVGLGFVFAKDDPYCGMDLDSALSPDGTLKEWAEEIVGRFAGAYMEVSPSGWGIKLWVKARLSGPGKQFRISRDERIEIYDRGRSFAVTAKPYGNPVDTIADHQEAVDWLYRRLAQGVAHEAAGDGHHSVPEVFTAGTRHDALLREAGRQAQRYVGDAQRIFDAIFAFNVSRCSPPKDEHEVRSIVEFACREERAKTLATVGPGCDLLRFAFHDSGNAERLIAVFGSSLRYCHPMKKWLVWTGTHWAIDESVRAEKRAKLTMIEFLRQAIQFGSDAARKFALASLESRRIAGLLAMSKCELPIEPDQLDGHPMLLNFSNGTLDLKTGILGPHRREHLITKLIRHNYTPEATCPRFLSFLSRVLGVHPDASEGELEAADRLIAYGHRALGYSLTGTTREKAVFFAWGKGSNGKTTLLATFHRLLGDYAAIIQVDSLMAKPFGESSNSLADLADLRGSRFVMTSETEEGQRLAEGKLKRITQGMGRVKTTQKYENPIEFDESHKLWIDGNYKPVIRGTDDAIWNRLHLIPFTVTVPKEEADPDLHQKLLGEAEGILAWAVAGCIEWQRHGLGRPPEVEQAWDAWRDESDPLNGFLEDRCIVAEEGGCEVSLLYESYIRWCELYKVQQRLTRQQFNEHLRAKGFRETRRKFKKPYSERAWAGVMVRAGI